VLVLNGWMPTMYEVRKSPIHGHGVFATRNIPIHSRIGVYEGAVVTRNSRYVLIIPMSGGGILMIKGTGPLRFLNHRRPGNSYFRAVGSGNVLWSRCNIKSGAEITFDYGEDL
jgi:hypothetical protein